MSLQTSTLPCSGCGRPVDPLRAAHVAIIDGTFRYFCGGECKLAFAQGPSHRGVFEAVTAAPPSVRSLSERPPSVAASSEVASGARTIRREHFPSVPPSAPASDPVVDLVAAPITVPIAPVVEAPSTIERGDDAPATLRSPAMTVAPASRPNERVDVKARAITIVPLLGIGAAIVAVALSLAGPSVAALRLPLALVAAVALVLRALLTPPDSSEPSPAIVLPPTLIAALLASYAQFTGAPHADDHVMFVAFAAGGWLAFQVLSSRAVRELAEWRTKAAAALVGTAAVERGARVDVDASSVGRGEVVVVAAGETVLVDGVVVGGSAEIVPWAESSIVIEKREGDSVLAGASVATGEMKVRATFVGADRAWLRLARLEERLERAAPFVSGARKIATRAALGAAVVVGGAVYASNGTWLDALLAACAGGSVLATLSAVTVAALIHARAQLSAQKRGILYKDARAFDIAGRADIAVVCSRGTVLFGTPELVAVEALGSFSQIPEGESRFVSDVDRVLSLASGAEVGSSDAFAAAVVRAARGRGIEPENMRSAVVHAGLGVTATSPAGDRVIVGSRSFLVDERISVAVADARVTELEAEGRSVLLVAVSGRLVGLIALQDGIRPGARAAVHRMHDAHIEPVFLSGEARDTCESIARTLDIEHVRPEILPGDRGAEVRALADGGRIVAAIGHPSADDGALGAADLSIAMEAAGAAPGEWGVALASNDVRDAALALTIARTCRDRARTVILLGAVVQALATLGVAFGALSPTVVPAVGGACAALVLARLRDPAISATS